MKKNMTRVSRRALCLAAFLIAGMASRAIARTPGQDSIVHAEVMAWSNITGVRLEGELIDFESTLRVGVPGQRMEQSGRERQSRIRYQREGNTQTTLTPMHAVDITQKVTDLDAHRVALSWRAEAKESFTDQGAYFCMTFTPRYYATARIKTSGRKVTVEAPERKLTLTFDRKVRTTCRKEGDNQVLYVTLLPSLQKGAVGELSAELNVDGVRHHETAEIAIDTSRPGREFAGLGGNFRLQNPGTDPMVINYCLRNMRVAFGRVEMPWRAWDEKGAQDEHVRQSAEMARRLKKDGMPVIVSCWFPPKWAGEQTTRSNGYDRAWHLKAGQTDRIYASLFSYLDFLKRDYGVEADYFSFNESDLGIDVVMSPQEHCHFIKSFGAYLAQRDMRTLLLLGDNSDATTFDFILPALHDPAARRYIGAISFHSWRGCDDMTLGKWAAAAREINVPLIVGEGSTDAAAWQYPAIFKESTFALYEINLYTRLCALTQPLSILQWQLTADYSLLWGAGIFRSEGPLRPTQRFFNLKQLSLTPAYAFFVPAVCGKQDVNVAAFHKASTGQLAIHIVNNAASCQAHITGLPANMSRATVYITNRRQQAEEQTVQLAGGEASIEMPAESFVTVIAE